MLLRNMHHFYVQCNIAIRFKKTLRGGHNQKTAMGKGVNHFYIVVHVEVVRWGGGEDLCLGYKLFGV